MIYGSGMSSPTYRRQNIRVERGRLSFLVSNVRYGTEEGVGGAYGGAGIPVIGHTQPRERGQVDRDFDSDYLLPILILVIPVTDARDKQQRSRSLFVADASHLKNKRKTKKDLPHLQVAPKCQKPWRRRSDDTETAKKRANLGGGSMQQMHVSTLSLDRPAKQNCPTWITWELELAGAGAGAKQASSGAQSLDRSVVALHCKGHAGGPRPRPPTTEPPTKKSTAGRVCGRYGRAKKRAQEWDSSGATPRPALCDQAMRGLGRVAHRNTY
ncbi:hypothetical protein BC827DRAFT_1154407 [Russula dissimulans]|nr:hypothetical protein BC827DRAFT_1154407 [Russula dissimulans]